MTDTTFRFRLYTAESVGAYTNVEAVCQADALAALQVRLPRWQQVAPLHGPNQTPAWFIV